MSNWKRAKHRREELRQQRLEEDEREAKRRRENPTSEERMLDQLETIANSECGYPNIIIVLANILRCHISGEEYYP